MGFITVLFVACCVVAPPTVVSAQSGTSLLVRSRFGFEVSLPAGWIQLGPSLASKPVPSAKDLGLDKANQKEVELYIGRVKSAKVEFYLDSLHSTDAFTNNISLQLEDEANDYSQYSAEEIRTFCEGFPAELSKTWGASISLKGCDVVSSNGTAVLAYSYIIPTQETFILQYVIPSSDRQTMVLVGGGRLDKDGVVRMQAAIRALAAGITGRAR